MKRRDLAAHMERITKSRDWNSLLSEQLTAEGVAQVFGLRRNTASQSLTVLVEQGVLFKLNTRPVYYFHTKAFANRFFSASKPVYASLEELLEEKPSARAPQDPATPAAASRDVFETLIGCNGSLKKAVEQIKTSLYYPSNRLPVILTGPTGVGKTFLAQKAYQYAIDNGVVGPTAPYINFNCAQYADNPELLSSHLFGYMKGAFTGAQVTTKGLLDAADGGFLFLDEVHRLNWESQEKLFTFMDQGVFRRIGQSDGWNRAEVRLLLATTEDPSQSLLATFLRRIPIQIQIPALEERGREEKLQLIYRCFLQESRILNREIQVSGKVLSALLAHTFVGNLGALENAVKYSCGSAQLKDTGQSPARVGLAQLPDYVLAQAPAGQGTRDRPLQDLFVTPATQMEGLCRDNHPAQRIIRETFGQLNERYLLRRKETDAARLEEDVPGLLYACFDKLLRLGALYSQNALMQLVARTAGETLSQLEHRFQIRFRDGAAQTLALYLYACMSGHTGEAHLLSELGSYVKEHFGGEYKIAQGMFVLLTDRLEHAFSDDDLLFVTLALYGRYTDGRLRRVRALILDRGQAASAIAAAANQLLGGAVYDALDIPVDDKTDRQREERLLEDLSQYLSENNIAQGLLLMGDKQLLEYLCAALQPQMDVPLAVMNHASVGMACAAGRLIQKGASLEDIMTQVEQECPGQSRTLYPKANRPRCLLTCCITGVGTARQITGIIRRSLPASIRLQVLEQDYGTLAQQKINAPVFKSHEVIGIVGTRNPDIRQMPYLPLEDLMTGQGEETLYRMLGQDADKGQVAQFHSNLVQEFSLGRMMETLTILDAKKLLRQIEQCLGKYLEATGRQISSSKKALAYFHISCMVERLLRAHGDDGEAEEEYSAEQLKKMKELQYFLEDLELRYNVSIPTKELGYLYEILSADD